MLALKLLITHDSHFRRFPSAGTRLSFLISPMFQYAGLLDSRLSEFSFLVSPFLILVTNAQKNKNKSKCPGVKGGIRQERTGRQFLLVKSEEKLKGCLVTSADHRASGTGGQLCRS